MAIFVTTIGLDFLVAKKSELPDTESHEDHTYCQPPEDPDGNDRFECHAGIGAVGIGL